MLASRIDRGTHFAAGEDGFAKRTATPQWFLSLEQKVLPRDISYPMFNTTNRYMSRQDLQKRNVLEDRFVVATTVSLLVIVNRPII